DLSGCGLNSAYFSGARMSNAIVHDASLDSTQLGNADLEGASFYRSKGMSTSFLQARMSGCNLGGASLRHCFFHQAAMNRALLVGGDFARSEFDGADLTGANARLGHFQGANLRDTILRGAMFEGVVVDDDTGFQNAEVEGCRIERHVLERLNNYGDLTRGRLMTMVIVDPVVTLRSYYSGFWQWIHVMALTLFLAPYVV